MPRNHLGIGTFICLACQFASLMALTFSYECSAQSIVPMDEQPTSYERMATVAPTGQVVRFSRRAPLVGDQLEQSLSVTLKLDTMVRQNQEVLEQTKTALRRQQRRVVTTAHVTGGTTDTVFVRYAEAAKRVANGPNADELEVAPPTPQSVEGKSYRCTRAGDALLITDEQGGVPPLDEYEIVTRNMESLGRPNPLADYLVGQTLAVGQRLAVPNEVAEKLLGLGDEMGQVSRFELTLERIAQGNGRSCAVFFASIEAASSDSSQMRLNVEGPLTIEIDTCRAVAADLSGPIGMSETRGSLSATYQIIGTGKMSISIASKYNDLQR